MATLNIKNLPDGLYRRFQRRAKERHRSTAQEATHILSVALEKPETRSILELKGLGRSAWREVDPARHVRVAFEPERVAGTLAQEVGEQLNQAGREVVVEQQLHSR